MRITQVNALFLMAIGEEEKNLCFCWISYHQYTAIHVQAKIHSSNDRSFYLTPQNLKIPIQIPSIDHEVTNPQENKYNYSVK